MNRETYSQAIRSNGGRPTCTVCFVPMAYKNPLICDACFNDLSRSGQLLERTEPCKTSK